MKLLLDPGHSHRWHRNMRRWLDLYEGDGAPLDDVAFTCNLAPGLGAIKVALLHYVAERHLYLAQMDMLSAAMEVTPAEWAGEVDSLALRGMTDFLGDVRTLLTPDLVELVGDVDLSPEASLGDLFADAWPVGLHDLERETLARPRDRALLGRWLHITLQAKLGEAMQTFRRSALGYWLARRHRSAAPLREVVAANVEPFGWRLSQIMHRQFVPEKVDPRSHRRLRWSGTRMDSE
ncbi:MAG TPA: hypothetical protein GX702_01870, partial [Chloroflexi bacterium]|nr:hypothetical protein [Chloroflexota bacterium]